MLSNQAIENEINNNSIEYETIYKKSIYKLNKEQLELLKYAVLWYECNDQEEEELMSQIEEKIYDAQEDQALRVLHGL